MMDHIFDFCINAFGEGSELVLLLTTLTVDHDAASYISQFGHDRYVELSSRLMTGDPTEQLTRRIEALDL